MSLQTFWSWSLGNQISVLHNHEVEQRRMKIENLVIMLGKEQKTKKEPTIYLLLVRPINSFSGHVARGSS